MIRIVLLLLGIHLLGLLRRLTFSLRWIRANLRVVAMET